MLEYIKENALTDENFQKYFIVYFIIFGIIISFAGTLLNYFFYTQYINKSMDIKAQEIFEIKTASILKPEIENLDNIVEYLTSDKIVREFLILKQDQEDEIKKFENIFLAIVGIENKILQARILDKNGKELIRADRDSKTKQPYIIKRADLQDKSERDYFKKLSNMKTEAIWHSKIDLNVEHGKIEIPYKPTLRVAMPIINKGLFEGAIIVNMLLDDLFAKIGTSSAFEHFIIDKENNYIYHPNDTFSFNKYKGVKREIKDDFSNGLNSDGVYIYSIDHILKNDDKAALILKTKENYEKNLFDELLNTTLIVLIINLILSTILSFYVAKKPKKLQTSLLNAHKKLRSFTSIIDRYVITATTKPNSTILDVSSAFEKSSGYTKKELIGEPMGIIKNKSRDKSIIEELWATILSKQIWIGEIKNRKKDGTSYWLEQHIIPNLNEKNEIESFVSIGIDITAKKELEKLATIDKLTGIYNRRRIEEFLQIEMEVAKRHFQALSVIVIDIDHFKSVNDTYGHQAGDMVLAQSTKVISQNLRKSDIFGRWGGEEFVVICPQTNKSDAFVLAQKLRIAIERHEFEQVGHKTICLGIAELEHEDDEKTLIEKADKALYEAKNSGRNKAVIFART